MRLIWLNRPTSALCPLWLDASFAPCWVHRFQGHLSSSVSEFPHMEVFSVEPSLITILFLIELNQVIYGLGRPQWRVRDRQLCALLDAHPFNTVHWVWLLHDQRVFGPSSGWFKKRKLFVQYGKIFLLLTMVQRLQPCYRNLSGGMKCAAH